MNSVIDFLNLAGDRFLAFAWPMLWQSSLLIALLLILDIALRKRVRATVRYALWLLVPIKLILPVNLSLPTSPGYWWQPPELAGIQNTVESSPVQQPFGQRDPSVDRNALDRLAPTASAELNSILPIRNRSVLSHLNWRGWITLAWMGCVLTLFVMVLARARSAWFARSSSGNTAPSYDQVLAQCKFRLGIRARVSLRLSDSVAAPVVCGLFRPAILLPQSLAGRLEPEQLKAVLLHELAHVRRRDLWASHVQTALQLFYFYNPLLWIANGMIRRVREQAVDEMVLVALANEAAIYPETLLTVAKLMLQKPRLEFGLIGIFENKSSLSGRIRLMLLRPWPTTARLGVRGGIVLILLGAVLLPMSRGQKQDAAALPAAPTNAASASASSAAVHSTKSMQEWLDQIDFQKGLYDKDFVESIAAFRAMGKDALPFLKSKLAPATTPASQRRTAPDRRKAAWVLKELGTVAEPVVPELTAALEDEEDETCAYAAMALSEIGLAAKSAVPALTESLRFGNGAAATALVRIDPDNPALVPLLIDVLQHAEDKRRSGQSQSYAEQALERLGPKAKPAIPALREALSSSSGVFAAFALRRIAWDQPDIVAEANKLLVSKPQPVTNLDELISAAEKADPSARGQNGQMAFQLLNQGVWASKEQGPPLSDEQLHGRILPLVARLLDSGRPGDFNCASFILMGLRTNYDTKQFDPKLIQFLQQDDSSARIGVENALIAIDPGDPATLPAFLKLLNDPNDSIRQNACAALTHFGPEAKEAVPVLHERLKDSSTWVRFSAMLALWRIAGESPSLEVLQQTLRDDSSDFAALRTLEMLGGLKRQNDQSRSMIQELTQHWSPEVRTNAQMLLKKIGVQSRADGFQLNAVKVDLSPSQSQWAAGYRADLSTATNAPAIPPALGPQLKKLHSQNEDVRLDGLTELARMGSKARDAIPFVLPLLNDGDVDTRSLIVSMLADLDPQGWLTVEPLIRSLQDTAPEVRANALVSLGKMGTPNAARSADAVRAALSDTNLTVRIAAANALTAFHLPQHPN